APAAPAATATPTRAPPGGPGAPPPRPARSPRRTAAPIHHRRPPRPPAPPARNAALQRLACAARWQQPVWPDQAEVAKVRRFLSVLPAITSPEAVRALGEQLALAERGRALVLS